MVTDLRRGGLDAVIMENPISRSKVILKSFTYLGTTISESRKLNDGINDRTGKAGRLFNSLRRPFSSKKHASTKM